MHFRYHITNTQEISKRVAQELVDARDAHQARCKIEEAMEELRRRAKEDAKILVKAMADIATPRINEWARTRRSTVRALLELADKMELMVKTTKVGG